MDGHPVDVEVAVAQGLPVFTIVGLPDPSIQEARERVRAAIQSSSETWPLKRVTVNLSPAHLRKAGSSFDLAKVDFSLLSRGTGPIMSTDSGWNEERQWANDTPPSRWSQTAFPPR